MNQVYIELLFADNAALNLLAIWATCRIAGGCTPIWRMVLGAAAGGVYAVLAFAVSPVFFHLAFKILVSAGMCAIVFGVKPFKKFARLAVLFFLVSFAIAGAMLMCAYFFGGDLVVGSAIVMQWDTARYIILGGALGILVLEAGGRMAKKRAFLEGTYTITFLLFKKDVVLNAIVDTGNGLYDPISGKSVIIADLEQAARQIAPEEAELLRDYEKLALSNKGVKVRLFPFQTIGGSGSIPGIKMNSIVIHKEKEAYKTSGYIAFTPEPMGEYGAILGTDLKLLKIKNGLLGKAGRKK